MIRNGVIDAQKEFAERRYRADAGRNFDQIKRDVLKQHRVNIECCRETYFMIPIEKRGPISIVRTEPLDMSAERTMGPRAHRTVSARGHVFFARSNFEVQDVA